MRASDDSEEYVYVSEDEFHTLVRRDLFVSHNEIHGFYHGALKSSVDETCCAEKLTVADISVYAGERISEYIISQSREVSMRSVYLDLQDSAELRERLKQRNEDENSIQRRLADSRSWAERARQSIHHFEFIDARQSQEEVLARVIAYFTDS